jgi:secretion/DNA translocation related TadE-like protein
MTEDRGAATMLAVVVVALLGLLTWLAGGVAAVVVAQRRVEAAADLAALAGAGAAVAGRTPCPTAKQAAERNGGMLIRCAPTGPDVTVRVAWPATSVLGHDVVVHADARAGPG